jgi:DNA polymerase-3 subunit delta'
MIREADRLSPAAADTLLKVLEEPPADAVLILMSARAHELPETVMSRCHVVTFTALTELFVVEQLANEGVSGVRAQLAARLSGGNLGRARRLALAEDGLSFRDVAGKAIELSRSSPSGALEAAREVLSSAASYKEELDADERKDLEPFVDDQGREQDAYRAAIRRIKERYKRRRARAEREHVDRVLLGMSSQLRDCIATGFGGSRDVLMNPDLAGGVDLPMPRAVAAMGAIEEARASLAEDLNLNPRLVLEQAFLGLASTDAS